MNPDRILILNITDSGFSLSDFKFIYPLLNSAPSENRDFGPPLNFGAIAYWSREFVCNRSRLLIGRELTLDLGLGHCHCFSSRDASDASTTCTGPWDCTLLTCCVTKKIGEKIAFEIVDLII